MQLVKRIFVVALLLLVYGAVGAEVSAQKVSLETNAPSMSVVGKAFRVEYSINKKPDSFEPPAFVGFDVLAGPTVSSGKQVSISGGNMVQSESYTYTYVLLASSEGRFNIPSAKAIIDGKEYASKSMPIEIVDEGQEAEATDRGSQQATTSGASVAADDILILALVDKTNVYKGQPVRVTYKLYTRVQIAGSESAKMPAFNGFWNQELSVDHYSTQRETYNSKIYDTRIIAEYLLYPQQSGTLTIEQLEITYVANIVVQSQSRQRQSVFDDFFNSGPDIQQISRKVTTRPTTIRVNDFPGGAPASFNGAVGDFSMTSEMSSDNISANSSATYSIKISGTGNLPLIQAPRLELPTSFEQYNIKTTESLNKTASGISGYRQFEYPLIARTEGSYMIDPAHFTYFNPETAKYVTLSTREQRVAVAADSLGSRNAPGALVSGLSKEDIKILGQDIRFIKLGQARLMQKDRLFLGSVAYFLSLGGLIIAAIGVHLLIARRRKEMGNVELLRGKRANKVALQRLRVAQEHMNKDSQRGFYEEMLKALWGYMSDKLNIPTGIITKEIVREELVKRGVAADQITKYIDLISECEYAQYSPDSSGHMNDVYRAAVEVISKFESSVKKRIKWA